MNQLILPKPFTAIWHRDNNTLEVIWTAFKVAKPHEELIDRKFLFVFEGREHECEFGDSTERLITIAAAAQPVGLSDTLYRNLQSYHTFAGWRRATKDKPDAAPFPGKPISFFIRNVEWDESTAIRLAKHINFYLTYFDHFSPHILIWPPTTKPANPRTRYLRGSFPARIDGHDLGGDVLQFWSACREGDAARRFVYYYRIIEHSSYTYVERDVRTRTRRLLGSADALSDVRGLADKVIAIVLGSDMDDAARIAALLFDAVEPTLLWREIEMNRKAFEEPVVFDGGYTVKPLITKDDTEVTFANNGLQRFAGHARGIRNHLSHGRDRTTLTSITPTTENFRKLEPWVGAISVVAGEVMTHRGVLL